MKINENKEWTESGLKTETEYVLSQKEWDELQARSKELEWKNVRLRLALKRIISATVEFPAHIFVRMVAREALNATDEGADDDA